MHDPKHGSIMTLRECLQACDMSKEVAAEIVEPLRKLHELRTKLRGHAASQKTRTAFRSEAIGQYGSLREHFRALVENVRQALQRINLALSPK